MRPGTRRPDAVLRQLGQCVGRPQVSSTVVMRIRCHLDLTVPVRESEGARSGHSVAADHVDVFRGPHETEIGLVAGPAE
jgi:hypothetical protein